MYISEKKNVYFCMRAEVFIYTPIRFCGVVLKCESFNIADSNALVLVGHY